MSTLERKQMMRAAASVMCDVASRELDGLYTAMRVTEDRGDALLEIYPMRSSRRVVIFRPDLAEKVLSGEKTVTRRLCSENPRSPWWREQCAFLIGGTYAVQAKRGTSAIGHIRIMSATREQFSAWPSLEECRREGFDSVLSFERAWCEITGGRFDFRSEVWRIEFEAVEVMS